MSAPPSPVYFLAGVSHMGFFDWLTRRITGKVVPTPAAPPAPIEQPTASAAPAPAPPGATAPGSPMSPVANASGSPAPLPGQLDLNAADFLPMAREEMKEAAKDVRRWGPWFGRRDLIPPADDLRTKLI